MFINTFNEFEYNLLLKSFDNPSYRGIRMNPKKMNGINIFSNLELHPFVKNAYIYEKIDQNYGKIPFHAMGCYYIQEPSAMLVGELLDVKEDDYIADLCAAPGGKSTHVGLKLNDIGFLLTNDINSKRALDLSENIERMGIRNALVINESIDKIANNYQGLFDKVILDAPCSGEGMFRKNDLAKLDWSMEKVNRCVDIQKSIILDAYKLLKYDGEMIYSTCTYNKHENEEMIQYLLDNTNAELIMLPKIDGVLRGINMDEAIRLLPSHFKGEGHFICKIRCKDHHEIISKPRKKEQIQQSLLKVFLEFEKANLNIKFDQNRLFLNKEHLYYLPNVNISTKNIHILRNGLYLGEIIKNRFEPSHSLAISSSIDEWKNVVSLDDEQINKYLKGESFNIDGKNGYCLVTYKNYSVGYAKLVNGTLKNHYPKGLRR